ncbi:MAG: hypothetical protein IJC50_05520 [Clostridia bacterium]|nr:hypothetical protein [Clostridia bacterium]
MKNKGERLYEILGQVDDDIVERTDPEKVVKAKKVSNFKWLSIAVCFVLFTVIGVIAWKSALPESSPIVDDNTTETNREIQPPADESYIKTYKVNNDEYQRMWLTMEQLLESAYVAEITVIGESESNYVTLFDEDYYNLVIEDMKNNGIELTEEELEIIKNHNTHTIPRTYLPVRYDKIYPSEDVVNNDLSHETIRSYILQTILEEAFVVGARFLVITWDSTLDSPDNVPPLNEYVFYIDSDNRLTPVFDIPTTAGYAGYTVDEFIEEIEPLFGLK